MQDALSLSLAAAAERIRAKELSPVALAEAALARIEATEPVLNAYALITADLALAAARRAEGEIAAGRYRGPAARHPGRGQGPLRHGGTADQLQLGGPARSCGRGRFRPASSASRRPVPSSSARPTPTSSPTASSRRPRRNPWNPDRIPGGSSGGSGAAWRPRGCFRASARTPAARSASRPRSAARSASSRPTGGSAARASPRSPGRSTMSAR